MCVLEICIDTDWIFFLFQQIVKSCAFKIGTNTVGGQGGVANPEKEKKTTRGFKIFYTVYSVLFHM